MSATTIRAEIGLGDETLLTIYKDGTLSIEDVESGQRIMLLPAAAQALREHIAPQPQPEIYIVQNDQGDVVDVFRDADEATEAYQEESYSVIEETIWEAGAWRAAVRGENA